MPIYEYKCKNCCEGFEILQKYSDPPLAKCPSCSGEVNKLISQSTFHLKGTGWYATDYARKGGDTASEEGQASVKQESDGEDKKVEAKGASDSTNSSPSGDSKE